MSLKEKVVLWQAGVENAVAGKFDEAVDSFTEIPEPSARIYFNISSAFLRLGNLEDAERVRDRETAELCRHSFLLSGEALLSGCPPQRITCECLACSAES